MQTATLSSKEFLNDNIIHLKLKTAYFKPQAGQRMFFKFEDEQWTFKRAYSIADFEKIGDEVQLSFLIKILPDGRASQLIKNLKPWTTIELEGPNGHFLLKPTKNPKVFLSTGSGLAPCYLMAKEDKSAVKKRFFFSVSYEKDLFFVDEIKALKIPETHINISREEVKGYGFWRIEIEHFTFPPETEFYICGVPSMVKDFIMKLKAKGFTKIYFEAY